MLVVPLGSHRVKGVGYRDDSRLHGNLIARQTLRITSAVDHFVMHVHAGEKVAHRRNLRHDLVALLRMRLHDLKLFVRKRRRFLQDPVIDTNLAHIMKQGADANPFDFLGGQTQALRGGHGESRHALRVAARVRIFTVDSSRQRLDCAEEQFVVFVSRPLQVADKALNLVRHLIERRSQFSQLSSAQHLYAL